MLPRLLRTLPALAALAAAAVLGVPATAGAQDTPTQAPRTSTRVPVFLGIDTTPLKLVLVTGIHQRHVYHASRSPLFDGLYADAGLGAVISPSSMGPRVQLEWMPLAVLVLKVSHSMLWYTGVPRGMGHGLSFADARSPYGADTWPARAGTEEKIPVQRSVASLTLRGKFWRLAAMSETEVALWYVPPGSGGYWYESVYDLLVARGRADATVFNRTLVLFEALRTAGGMALAVGPVNEYVHAVGAGLARERLGVALTFTPGAQVLGARDPLVVVMAGATLAHPNRQGEIYLQAALSGTWEL